MPRIALLKENALAPDQVRRVELDSRPPVAVYNLDGTFFVTDDTCTHGEASLADGDIEYGNIVCPFHLGMFDIRTGAATAAPCVVSLQTYQAIVEDGIVYIDIDP